MKYIVNIFYKNSTLRNAVFMGFLKGKKIFKKKLKNMIDNKFYLWYITICSRKCWNW